jgi:mRNA interferase RelE/StbE
MESYKIEFAKSVRKDFRGMPKKDARRILACISELADDPRTPGSKKLSGEEVWRIRIGQYRVIYEIHDNKIMVLILKVGNRKDIYRK